MSRLEFLKVAEDLLRRRKDVFASIKGGQNLNRFVLNANLCTMFFAAIYGATMGALPSGLQILYNIKIPLLLLISLYVALQPTTFSTRSLAETLVFGRLPLCLFQALQ